MGLYLLTRDDCGYDENRGFVICAHSYTDARKLAAASRSGDEPGDTWLDHKRSKIKLIGYSLKVPRGIVLSDFRAG